MLVRFQKMHEKAVIPEYARLGDAGLDLTAVSFTVTDDYVEYDTGIAVEVPAGYVGLVFPRSSISKYDLALTNCVGVVDSGYRGTIKFRFKLTREGFRLREPKVYVPGDRVGQLVIMPYPQVTPVEVDQLTSTSRGDQGFGSSGN